MLPPFEKKEVSDFIDFLFSRSKKNTENENPEPEISDYKKGLLSVSVWNDEDLKVFEENNKHFKQWEPPTW